MHCSSREEEDSSAQMQECTYFPSQDVYESHLAPPQTVRYKMNDSRGCTGTHVLLVASVLCE